MQAETVQMLNDLNREFYQTFASSFSSTRIRIQPGVRRILEGLPKTGGWLDVGCGNGNFALALVRSGRHGSYLGIDGSTALIQLAEKRFLAEKLSDGLKVRFLWADFTGANWLKALPEMRWDCAFLFAVLHHIPGQTNREELCRQIHRLLKERGRLYMSVWQVQNSPRLLRRIQPWSLLGLMEDDLDRGDVLVDWRVQSSREEGIFGYRYVHIFDAAELLHLAEMSGFQVERQFFSDGKEGNLGLYQTWERA